MPELELLEKGRHHQQIMAKAVGLKPIRTAVVYPVDTVSLVGALEAAKANLIIPVLIGPEEKVCAAARLAQLDLSSYELITTENNSAAASRAVAMVREAKVDALMKGDLHTDELMHAVVDPQHGLRTDRRITHVFVMDVASYPRPLLLTDAAINIFPTLDDKREIVQNAIDLAHALGITLPKVAILSGRERALEDSIHSRGRGTLQDGGPWSDQRRHSRWTVGFR